MADIPMWIFVIFAVGAILYLYIRQDSQYDIDVAFVFVLLGTVLGGIFL